AILRASVIEHAIKMRKQNALCIVDLALPRDIEPAVAKLENVYLYTLDNLTRIVDVNKNHRLSTVDEAQKIITDEIQNFMQRLNTRQVAQLISQLKANADEQSDEIYQKSLKLIKQGKDPSEALAYLKQTLTAKLMHRTIEVLNKAAEDGDADLIKTASRLYTDDKDKQ
ncbi:MAG: glutamyl-tRNA reductase, partial [Gammaproteobacteria bacterium]|nr:glutamyl-tRNA reductase [Gammaproteobacteria bacterium]